MSESQEFTPPHPLDTAVLFLVFNRPDTTKQVFEAIRQAKPPRLYVAADGPREEKLGEADRVKRVRDYVMENVDWECEVYTLFRDKNLGCKYAVSGAITWFFEHEEQGIILEDDCLPSQSFFWYCEELLDRYKDDETVYLISGDSRGSEKFIENGGYSFCKYPLIWGWASWKNVWEKYDPEMRDWPEYANKVLEDVSKRKSTKRFWRDAFSAMYSKKIDTWDFQFSFLLIKNSGRCVVPKFNLISNIGFGEGATHTFDVNSGNSRRRLDNIQLPISDRLDELAEADINEFFDRNEFSKGSFAVRLLNRISRSIIGKNII